MTFSEYMEELINIFMKSPKKMIFTTLKIWLFIPFLIFLIYVTYLILFGITEGGILKMFELAINISLPWWLSIITAPFKVLIELIVLLFIVLTFKREGYF